MFIFYDSVFESEIFLFLKKKNNSVIACVSFHEKKRKWLGYLIQVLKHDSCGVVCAQFFAVWSR